jgi:hypothetical protein
MGRMAERHDPHAGESMVGPHGTSDDHGSTQGHDDHGHAASTLGPVDVQMWAAAAVGVLLGLVVMLALIQAAA